MIQYNWVNNMKKLLIFLIVLFISQNIYAAYEYPVLPDNLEKVCLARFGFDDTGSRLLYEKVPITGDFSAWMLGWFWDDYKIVIGITDECDVIYFNRASLTGEGVLPADVPISSDEGLEVATRFLTTALGGHKLRLTSGKGYTYNFSEFHNGIRVVGHDATVVVDKASGEVYYYKGFGKYNAEYKLLERMVSKSSAFDTYFSSIGLELVYSSKYDPVSHTKTTRPMYIFNNTSPAAVDAETGQLQPVLMYDYNYYYNDNYYDPKFSRDNNISGSEGIFEPKTRTHSDFAVQKLKNIFYTLRMGYSFETYEGTMYFANGKAVPAMQVNIAPDEYKHRISEFSALYDRNDTDIITLNPTHKEYSFARAYVNASTGEILKFTSLQNEAFTYRKPLNYVKASLPRRVSEFIVRASDSSDELKLFSQTETGEHTTVYTYARYINGARVIGEGALIEFNSYSNDITNFVINTSSSDFTLLEGIKSIPQMAEIIKTEIPFELCYTDCGEGMKKVVYDFAQKSAEFDPVSGTRIDSVDKDSAAQRIICTAGSEIYSVNGSYVTASPPAAINNKIYLPVRFIADILGFDLEYSGGTVILTRSDDEISVKAGSADAFVNGRQLGLSDSPVLLDNTMYISSNGARQIFGLHISWDEESNKIFIIP